MNKFTAIIAAIALVGCAAEDTSNYPTNNISYKKLDKEVGCSSNLSDDKKDNIFASDYKNNWMTWSGKVVLVESNEVSLNIDGFGSMDLNVEFADKNAGYDISVGDNIKVKFVMKIAGGCIMPFIGYYATVE